MIDSLRIVIIVIDSLRIVIIVIDAPTFALVVKLDITLFWIDNLLAFISFWVLIICNFLQNCTQIQCRKIIFSQRIYYQFKIALFCSINFFLNFPKIL